MDLTNLTIADLYAAKSQAKEKESFYRSIKQVNSEYFDSHKYWAEILQETDAELSLRILNLKK